MPKPRFDLDAQGLMITGADGQVLLGECTASVQLSSGTRFPLEAMEPTLKTDGDSVHVRAGGSDVWPLLEWDVELAGDRDSQAIRIQLRITNTTTAPLSIERMDVLIARNGYRQIPSSQLQVRRMGWQSFGITAVRAPFDDYDPWLQPPLHMPIVPVSAAEEQQFPWMTVLQSKQTTPMLLGFEGARDYLGMLHVSSREQGHRLAAANYLEGIELATGDSFTSEPLLLLWDKPENELLDEYADLVGEYMQARVPDESPTGWSSWFAYFTDVTEKGVSENARYIQQNKLPLQYVQIDDGYQTAFGDWLSINTSHFPRGMKAVADDIKATGSVPGIWLTPFMANAESEVYKQHPKWFLHDSTGRPINANRHGDVYWPQPNYGLDITHPEAYEWLKQVMTTICDDWGFEYIKVDYLYAGALRAQRYDPAYTSVQAYRRGLELIREVAGERFVLGCGAPLLCSVGYVDGMRINGDLLWSSRPRDYTLPRRDPLTSLMSHIWMNKKWWVNDSDYIHVRQHDNGVPWHQAQTLTALIALAGGAIHNSDNLLMLEPAGMALLKRALPPTAIDARPIAQDNGRPNYMAAYVAQGDGEWWIISHFNWTDHPVASRFTPGQWQLPNAAYHVFDMFENRYLGQSDPLDLNEIPALGTRLLCISPVIDRPSVVGSSGHLLGPAGDIASVQWQANSLHITLAGSVDTSALIYIYTPANYKLKTVTNGKIISATGTVSAIKPSDNECVAIFVQTAS